MAKKRGGKHIKAGKKVRETRESVTSLVSVLAEIHATYFEAIVGGSVGEALACAPVSGGEGVVLHIQAPFKRLLATLHFVPTLHKELFTALAATLRGADMWNPFGDALVIASGSEPDALDAAFGPSGFDPTHGQAGVENSLVAVRWTAVIQAAMTSSPRMREQDAFENLAIVLQ